MGKNRTIQIIADLIGGMVAHKILAEYTNKPESIHHMESEIENYRSNLSDYIIEFNWNDFDKSRIKQEVLKSLKSELKKPHFKDVKFPAKEVDKLIEEISRDILG